jgi:hypothetical protein
VESRQIAGRTPFVDCMAPRDLVRKSATTRLADDISLKTYVRKEFLGSFSGHALNAASQYTHFRC